MENAIEILNSLPDVHEVWEVRSFRIYRHNVELAIDILDAGRDAGHKRYMVEASVVDGGRGAPHSLGDPESTIEAAIHNVHWWEFD